MEVKDIISMLRFLANPRDGISFHRIANKPARGMGDALVGRLEHFAEQHQLDLLTTLQERNLEFIRDEHDKPLSDAALRACREARHVFDIDLARKSVAQTAMELFTRSHYEDWLKSRYDDRGEFEDRRRNVDELLNAIAEFSRTHPRASVVEYLDSISLYMQGDDTRNNENAVRLMSLHASKGLEFDVVYLIGLEHKILPHEKALADRKEAGLNEERRLCYVGFTRARKILRVTWCTKRPDAYARTKTARFKPSIPSQFLLEAGLVAHADFAKAMEDAGMTPTSAVAAVSPVPRAKSRKKASSGRVVKS
jgi:DNA helicase-2/ATP-dependent DNA helicase PcrA